MDQLFCKQVNCVWLFELLDKICLKKDKYYVIDTNTFRKMLFHNYHEDFFKKIKNCYHLSKQFYITRKLTYNSFTNIIRQICKQNNIMFTSNIKYGESKYSIEFYIYYT
jgi:hypothetical protein